MPWAGEKAPILTSQQLGKGSSFGKSDPTLLKKMAFLLEENHRLKEEIRLLKASMEKTYDI